MSSPRVTVAILNYDGRRLLEVVLPSLAAQRYRDFDVLVVDNGSTDDSLPWLAEHWPQVRVRTLPENVGVTAALNVCVRAAEGELVALLNNDMELHADFLGELVGAIEHRGEAAVVAAKLLDYRQPNLLDGAGDLYTWRGEANRRGQGELDLGQYDEPGEVFSACGGAALYRRSALERVGEFDEQLFAIYEDVDWSFRARLAGYRCLYVPGAIAYHMGSATLGRGLSDFTLYHNWRNGLWVIAKNWPMAALARHAPALILAQAMNLGWAIRRGRARVWARVWRDALRGLPTVLRKRRRIQRNRIIGLRELERVVGDAP